MMLGSSRQTVSGVASALQKEGIISYAYGRVDVLDRVRLEHGAWSMTIRRRQPCIS